MQISLRGGYENLLKVNRGEETNKQKQVDELRLVFVCFIWLFTSQSTIFQLCQDWSSWIEPVLSKD